MRNVLIFTMLLAFTLINTGAYALISPVETKPDWLAQKYLLNNVRGIGFVDSYQEDNSDKAYVYDSTLAAMAFMAMGNFGVAKEIFDTLAYEVARTTERVFYESYSYYDYNGYGQGTAYCGNTAWLLQAFNMYQKLRNSKEYYTLQKQLADFLLTLQDPIDGGLRGSTYENWKSTEHNIMAYVALRNFGRLNNINGYVTKAEKIKTFLKSPAIWNGTYFNQGPYDTTGATDVQAYGTMLLGSSYYSALTWAEENLKVSLNYNFQDITGFDFNDDRDTVWLEGTLQMAFAFYKSSSSVSANLYKAYYYAFEADQTIQADGSLLLALQRGTATPFWTLEPWHAAAPTAWIILFNYKFNPLTLY